MLGDRLKEQFGTLAIGAVGVFFVAGSLAWLDLGTPRRMGPGAFPLIVGLLLTALAAVTLLREFRAAAGNGAADWRAVASVIAGVSGFAMLTPALGLLPGAACCVLASSYAVHDLSFRARAGLTAAAVLGVWLIFIVGLRMPFEAVRGL